MEETDTVCECAAMSSWSLPSLCRKKHVGNDGREVGCVWSGAGNWAMNLIMEEGMRAKTNDCHFSPTGQIQGGMT